MPSPSLQTLENGSIELPSRSALGQQLACPFPLRLNPHVERAHTHSGEWMRRHFTNARVIERTQKARMAWLVAGFYPEAGEAELSLAADYLCWAFALDDLGDETRIGKKPGELAALFERFDTVFSEELGSIPPRPIDPNEADRSVEALRDIVRRLGAFATREQLEAFRFGNRAYFGGMLWEANNRARSWVPNESSFLTMRPAAGAVPPFFSLIEPLEGLRLDEEVKRHPQVEELGRLAGGIVCWTNDVLSYEKERRLGDVHNLATVYEVHRRLSPTEALHQAILFNNTEVAGFLDRAETLPDFGERQNRELERYASILGSVMRITTEWTLGSARYAGDDRLALQAVNT